MAARRTTNRRTILPAEEPFEVESLALAAEQVILKFEKEFEPKSRPPDELSQIYTNTGKMISKKIFTARKKT